MTELVALQQGRCHDPHRILGIHHDGCQYLLRVLRPNARKVTARVGQNRVNLTPISDGLYQGIIDLSTDYRSYIIEVEYQDGVQRDEYDGYAFPPTISDYDLYLFGEGRHWQLTKMLGARPFLFAGVEGFAFSVWAPNAEAVALVGDFNYWNARSLPMRSLGASGVWELFVPGVKPGACYKFSILGRDGVRRLKADPVASWSEVPPDTASKVFHARFEWTDAAWLTCRSEFKAWEAPISIYEVHLGSWRKDRSYRDLALELAEYVSRLGFTHVELLPIMEHPFAGSWGYQVTGFFAPTARFGDPDEFRHFVDILHSHGVGVILDWVPAHFPKDEWALARFDGTALYEHEDERRGFHPDWGTLVFNHGRNEVRSFLISSALHWIEEFHIDGLRVDAVASMIYLDYSRDPGQWIPNKYGGNEDLEATEFLRELNTVVYERHQDVLMVAEESTAWPGVTRRASEGGLGFGFKWNMGWMHDTLSYFSQDPIFRRYHHGELTFASLYSFTENFILPLSHDEVVYGKRSLLSKMPGDRWQQLANLRALFGFMWAHPGKQLLFMGGEFGQVNEWNHEQLLDWDLLDAEEHLGVFRLVSDLNKVYRIYDALWACDSEPITFKWISADAADQNVIAFLRQDCSLRSLLICVCNFSPVPKFGYEIAMPTPGRYEEVLNTDSGYYGGSDQGNGGFIDAIELPEKDAPALSKLTLPPLSTLWLVKSAASR